MKVYVVEAIDYDHSEILGVFSDKSKAEALATERKAVERSFDYEYLVSEHELQ